MIQYFLNPFNFLFITFIKRDVFFSRVCSQYCLFQYQELIVCQFIFNRKKSKSVHCSIMRRLGDNDFNQLAATRVKTASWRFHLSRRIFNFRPSLFRKIAIDLFRAVFWKMSFPLRNLYYWSNLSTFLVHFSLRKTKEWI